MKYWINVVSRDHVEMGREGGYIQANHGKAWSLKKMKQGDYIVFYSPKTTYEGGEPLQAFTAICKVTDLAPYQVEISEESQPWRRQVDFDKTNEAPIKPLVRELDFIDNKLSWGYKFRFGVIEINESDFLKIKNSMTK